MTYSNLLDNKDWGFPVPIFYGPGRISDIGSICKNLEIRNPLIVTDRGSSKLSFIQELRSLLSKNGISSEVFFVSNFYLDLFDNKILNIPPYIFYIIFSVAGLFILALK